jgi:ribosomal protein L22
MQKMNEMMLDELIQKAQALQIIKMFKNSAEDAEDKIKTLENDILVIKTYIISKVN